jgi:uncharacterized protein YdhG (YjbR/CyaY superfamily)
MGRERMRADRKAPKDIDEYIAGFPSDVREALNKMRMTIRKAAPAAEEKISYMIPAFALNGPLVYFAAFKKHLAFFPTSSGVEQFKDELAAYETSKGTVRFPLGTPVPYGLIAKIVKFRVRENLTGAEAQRKKK